LRFDLPTGVSMKNKLVKASPRRKDSKRSSNKKKSSQNVATLRLHYKFVILIGVLILAGVSITLERDAPVIWTFLYGIGGWAALTNTPNIFR